jgi:hypothetical protein
MTMKKRHTGGRLTVVLLAMVSLATQASAQVADLRERAREALPADAFEELEALAGTAAEDGIPTDPLFDKAVEGVAKGIPPSRILPAVVAHADRLRRARGLLGGEVGPPVIVAGADALAKGVPTESLRELRPAERTSMALLVLGDLIEAGVAPRDAIALVREALGRGTADEAMLSIRPTVQRLLRDGRTPADAADVIRRALRDGRPIHRIPEMGRDGGGLDVPTSPGGEPVTRDRSGSRPGGAG